MKKKNIFLVALAFMGLTSCNDYLDVDAPSKYEQEFIFTDVDEANALLNGVYQALCNNNTYGNAFINTFLLNSDVEWATNTNEVQVASHNEYKAFDCEADGSALESTWAQVYTTIERANDFISGAEKSPILQDMSGSNEENRAALLQMIGEAKCIRAMNYFDLSMLMGDIPFSFERSYDHSDNLVIPIVDRDEMQAALINDLIEASKIMKTSQEMSTIERPTKEFAWALITRIALFRGGYSLRHTDDPAFIGEMKRPADWQNYYNIAIQYADSVINAGTHSLTKDWYDVFIDECKYIASTGDDPIFEIPFTMNVNGQVGYIHGPGYSKTVYDTWGNSNGGVRLGAFHRFTYDSQDVRRKAIGYWSYTENNPGFLNSQTNYCNKWSKLWDPNHTMDSNLSSGTGINFPYMRYADVLLMYAEAVNEVYGPDGAATCGKTAKEALSEVRERAFRSASGADKQDLVYDYVDAATSKDAFLKLIQDERKWEFAGEGLRWKDLVRWNIYNQVIYKTFWQFYGMAADDNSYDPNFANYPKRVFYKRMDKSDNDPQWDYSYPNQTLPQFKFWQVSGMDFDNLWQNWYYFRVNYDQATYEAELNNAQIAATGTNAWSSANWFNWEDSELSIPVAACRLSVRGYIYKDQSDMLQPAGMPDYTDDSVLANLPTLRYIMPIPQDAITRSGGAYKNYYGY